MPRDDGPSLQFLGAARTVTGSKFLLRAAGQEVLVDCGLFQGRKELRRRNWAPLPVPPAKIDAVVLTHAHVDHSGYLPRLAQDGFAGPIYCTPATAALLRLMLPDAAHIQEEEARYANAKGYSKHDPALPLFDAAAAERALRLVAAIPYDRAVPVARGVRATLRASGHILGAASVLLETEGVRLAVSGDLGGYGSEVMAPPAPLVDDVDHLVVESTYGGRDAEHAPLDEQLRSALAPALARGAFVVVPAFAIGRTTLVIYHLLKLMDQGALPRVSIHVDSPMATDAIDLYCEHGDDPNLRAGLFADRDACPIRGRDVHLARSVDESKALNDLEGPRIVVSASGMATGGRVLHHLKRRLPDPRNLVLLVGYQADGTRGRRLLDGEPTLRMLGRDVPVAAEVRSIRGLSAHGDSDDVVRWIASAARPPRHVHLVHGEEEALAALRARLATELGLACSIPDDQETVALR